MVFKVIFCRFLPSGLTNQDPYPVYGYQSKAEIAVITLRHRVTGLLNLPIKSTVVACKALFDA